MGLDYPGGPLIAKLAEKGDSSAYTFPRPMTDRPGLDFSFSGLKTFTLNTVEAARKANNGELAEQDAANIAAAFEDAVVETLAIKCRRALQHTGMKHLVIAGGVSANKKLRIRLDEIAKKERSTLFYARPAFCTDNGAMIAYAGCQRLMAGERASLTITAQPRWPMEQLNALGEKS